MKKSAIFSSLFLIVVWFILYYAVQRPFIIPSPIETIKYLGSVLTTSVFYKSIFMSLFRILFGFLLSLLIALILAIISFEIPVFANIFAPINLLTKTIPNISYMIIALIWFGSEGAVITVVFMILFPIFYNSFYDTLRNENKTLLDVERIYKESFLFKLKNRTLPQLFPNILATGKTAASLGFKVGVMAEILGSVNLGIGRQISFCKTQLDMAGIFAWTFVIILICVLLDYLFNILINLRINEEQGWKS